MKTLSAIIVTLVFAPVLLFSQTTPDQKKTDSINIVDASNRRTGYWEKKNGDMVTKGIYVNDKKAGNWITCVNTGLLLKLEYYENGLRNGISITLDRKGHLNKQEFYKNDKLNGLAIN